MIYSGQGPIFLGEYNPVTKQIENQTKVGCGNRSLKITLDRQTEKIKESCSGSRATLVEYEKEKTMNVSLELTEFDREMLATALYGATSLVVGASLSGVSAEVLPTMMSGKYFHTRHPFISALTIKDSSAAPATLVAGTHYDLEDGGKHGRILINNLATFTQPLKAEYTYASYGNINGLTESGVVKGLIFDGKSTIDGKTVRLFIPRISIAPTKEFNWLGDEAAALTLEGAALYTDSLASDALYGGFMRVDTEAIV